MSDRSRVPIGHIRANYINRLTKQGIKCVDIKRVKKNYFAKFSDNTTISCSDIQGFYNVIRRLEWDQKDG
jgi:hypothetical protein